MQGRQKHSNLLRRWLRMCLQAANIQEPSIVSAAESRTTTKNNESKIKRRPVFEDVPYMTDDDLCVSMFITDSYDDAKVVDIGDSVITVKMLRQNIANGFMIGPVIDAYAFISKEETESMSVLSTFQTRKLTGELGGIPQGCQSKWVTDIAKKCVGRDMVFVPMNVCDNHWLLVVLNFMKKEVQVLNSLPSSTGLRDTKKEKTLVESVHACIEACVDSGSVTLTEPLDITGWETHCYDDIPQQQDSHSCGAFVLKYVVEWDGDKMTHPFSQAEITTFRWKICTRLIYSDLNKRRQDSYEHPLTKEEYLAKNAEENQREIMNNDDIEEISNRQAATQSNISGPQKRKRGRPKKKANATNSIKAQFSTDTIAEQVENKRSRKPGPLNRSPYKKL